jgi:hypothetical protein
MKFGKNGKTKRISYAGAFVKGAKSRIERLHALRRGLARISCQPEHRFGILMRGKLSCAPVHLEQ